MKTESKMLILLGCALLNLSLFAQQKKEGLRFKAKLINFGELKLEQTPSLLTARFFMENITNAPLVILDIETGCRCVEAKWDKSPILAHSRRILTVTFDHKKRKGFFLKKIIIKTNDNSSIYLLKIKGIIN